MRSPSPARLWRYVSQQLHLAGYLRRPGDGRVRPCIPAQDLVWAQLLGQILREWSFHAVQGLVRSSARAAMGISRQFSDDALGYFDERADAGPTRAALAATIKRAKRNKAFRHSHLIGLALDGTGAGRSHGARPGCALCRPDHDANGQVVGYHHELCMAAVVGTGITLPVDVEPYGPGDSEHGAALRLLPRVVAALGKRLAQYVVLDAKFVSAAMLHLAEDLGLRPIVRLKSSALFQRAQARFSLQPPQRVHEVDGERVELWDAQDFAPWDTLRWPWVRVLRYRQHTRDSTVVEAYWMTNFSQREVSALTLFKLAKSRWEIENQGFNDAKNRHGMGHICRHEANSLLITWLLLAFALAIERLYRLCHLHRGTHPVLTAEQLVRLLWIALGGGRGPPALGWG